MVVAMAAESSNMKADSYQVLHDAETKAFTIQLSRRGRAVLAYEVEPGGVYDLWHTEVPSSHRGKGLGEVLARAALAHAGGEGAKVRLSCTYLQHFAQKYPHEVVGVVVDEPMNRGIDGE